MKPCLSNQRIHSEESIISPEKLLAELPLLDSVHCDIANARLVAQRIMQGLDKRLLVIVGPCSIHDPNAALDYASLLKNAATQFADQLFIIMRTYLEKPRTSIGWKGLINDPFLNGTFDLNSGLRIARKLLIDINEMGVPVATEFLDTLLPAYLSDAITWTAIGARTSSSQIHRELASGLPMPVGFKNSIDGNRKVAMDAVKVALHSHQFLSLNNAGSSVIVRTTGNNACHIILRGSNHGPNFEANYVELTTTELSELQLPAYVMIDCSHGNSSKNYLLQKEVIHSISHQLRSGSQSIKGVMLESNLIAGTQPLKESLVYGQSITDACLSWEQTLPLLEELASTMSTYPRRSERGELTAGSSHSTS